MSNERLSIFIFLVVTFLFWMSLYLYVPTLPTYIKTKTIDLSVVGLVLSMYGLWMAVARLPMGIVSDSLGWGKPLIILGIFFASLGAFIMGKGDTLTLLAVGRALTGLSAGTWVILIVAFSSFFSLDRAIFASSLLTFSASFGRMVATGLTGFLNQIGGYSFAFYLATSVGIMAMITVIFSREKKRPPKGASLRSIVQLFMRRDVLLPSVVSFIVHYADWSVTFGFLPILVQQMGAGDVIKSLLISVNIAAITAGNFLNTVLLRKIKHVYLLCCGVFFMFTGILILAEAPSVAVLFAGTLFMGFSFGIVYPILVGMSIERVELSGRSTAMGIHQSFYAIGMFFGPWLSGIIANVFGIRTMFTVTGSFYLIAVYLFIYLLFKMRNKDDT
jgi:predicted MFS family arabinose efflux permease